ncbi:MAG: tetratricopeptide repeat protein [bacterium]
MENQDKLSHLTAKIKAYEKYLPRRIVEKIDYNPYNVRVEGERRFVTILFGDVSGFTALSERLDPEDVIKVINKYFNKMLYIVDKYGGDVDKFVGDAIMVVFGAPVAHKNDPERAVRAALEMQEAIETIEPVPAKGELIKVRMSIGINTGEIVALNMGTDQRMEYTVMGDNVNLSARLEGVANAGQVIISDSTYKYVKNRFDFAELEPVSVKGKSEPIQIYQALNVRERDEFKRSVIAGLDEQKGNIEGFVSKSAEGGTDKLLITGDEGTGKSVLTAHFLDRADRLNINILTIKGESFLMHTPYSALKAFFKCIFEIGDSETRDNIKAKIDNVLMKEYRRGIYYLFELADTSHLDENTLISYIHHSLSQIIDARSASGELILFIDDYHHIDRQSKKVLSGLTEQIENIPVIYSSRTEPDSDFDIVIETPYLSEEQIGMMIEEMTGYDASDSFISAIMDKTGGHPGYTAALTEFMLSSELYDKEGNTLLLSDESQGAVPDSLKSIFLEKIDTLPESVKTLLQYASILGNTFSADYITRIFRFDKASVDEDLTFLTDNNYLRFLGGSQYRFQTEIFHNAVYSSLMKTKRIEVHNQIAVYFEKNLYPESREKARDISYHYDKAANSSRAPVFLREAGDLDMQLFAHSGAMGKYSRALEYHRKNNEYSLFNTVAFRIVNILISSGDLNKAEQFLIENEDIFSKDKKHYAGYYNYRGLVQQQSGKPREAEDMYRKSLEIAEQSGDEHLPTALYNQLSLIASEQGQYDKAAEYCNKALALSIKHNRLRDTGSQYVNLGRIYWFMGKLDNAQRTMEKALKIQTDNEFHRDRMITLTNLAALIDRKGNKGKAKHMYDEALEIARKIGDDREEMKILNNIAGLMYEEGDTETAMKQFRRIKKIAAKTRQKTMDAEVTVNIAELEISAGNLEKASMLYREAMQIAEEIKHIHLLNYMRIKYSETVMLTGYLEDALHIAQANRISCADTLMPELKILSMEIEAKIRGIAGALEEEESILADALKEAEKYRNEELICQLGITMVKMLIKKGEFEKAEKRALNIIESARKMNNITMLTDILSTAAELYQNMENRITELSSVASEAFEVSSDTDNAVALLRNNITLARFYLATEDYTSCDDVLSKAENSAEKCGIIEHRLAASLIRDRFYEMQENTDMLSQNKIKQLNIINTYIERAGKLRIDLIEKRHIVDYSVSAVELMAEHISRGYAREIINNLSDYLRIELLKNAEIKNLMD